MAGEPRTGPVDTASRSPSAGACILTGPRSAHIGSQARIASPDRTVRISSLWPIPPRVRVLYAGAVVDDAVRSLWAEPRAPGAPVRVRRDWALVAFLLVAAVLETVLHDDLVWPGVALALAVAHAFSLLW